MHVSKKFRLDAAHFLPECPEGHPCRGMHGHSYEVSVTCSGDPDPETGFVIDYHDIKRAVQPLVDQLDHSTLNDHTGLECPSTENLCIWFWQRLSGLLPLLSVIEIAETPGNSCMMTKKDVEP